jgi:hypothetical protein
MKRASSSKRRIKPGDAGSVEACLASLPAGTRAGLEARIAELRQGSE